MIFNIAKLGNGKHVQMRAQTELRGGLSRFLPLGQQPDAPKETTEIIRVFQPAMAAELLGVTPDEAIAELRRLVRG